MAFFNWLRRLLTPTRSHRPTTVPPRQATPVDRPFQPQRPTQQLTPTPQPTVPPVAVNPVTTHEQPNATLVVRIVDSQNRPLQPALVLTGQRGTAVHLTTPTIPGYTLAKMTGFTQTFLSEYGLMTLTYQRQWGYPVLVYQIDYDSGQLLALPGLFRGLLGASFHLAVPPVKGYHIFQAQGPQQGTYTDQTQRLLYFYRRDAWQTVQRVHQYVTLLSNHAVYALPAGQAYRYRFPATSLWRIFAIITLTDQTVWYNLGGNQWLNAAETKRRLHWSRHLELPRQTKLTGKAVQWSGTVDYVPDHAVTFYRDPYGEVAGQLPDGELLEIRRRVVDDQNLIWYQIGPQAYINARYVRLAKQV
ncbi:MucBP domain-containing protein [Levilactobacillus suantsaii]|uniref:MucBP domain-containing protein n=1 Tax=Levilactobacillus suantsaii TaxID=2292255 RepID=A0A4Q0VGY3_9LACO|nr:MucBP domain-containing protein [Levilactobacillus suantsaii]QMU07317.1 MucBP domain-containing protein [Levilactobacillus suantsaii]RXI77028.1 hypothetical protein DXH47_09745 [Levilactobacillus suantsaii]